MKSRIDLPAIHDKDLNRILGEFNLLSKFQNNELNCFNCNEVVNLNNLNGFVVDGTELKCLCSNPDCIAHATSLEKSE